jgi:hypothetical protein
VVFCVDCIPPIMLHFNELFCDLDESILMPIATLIFFFLFTIKAALLHPKLFLFQSLLASVFLFAHLFIVAILIYAHGFQTGPTSNFFGFCFSVCLLFIVEILIYIYDFRPQDQLQDQAKL